MARLPIFIAPAPCLKVTAVAVDQVDVEIKQLMEDMLETMHDANGIGLAAPQVNKKVRVLVMDIAPKGEDPTPICMANPEIVWQSDVIGTNEEGCLSLPELFADVKRPEAVRIKYLDQNNDEQELDAEGLLSTCVQHEIDHLDGKLFVDHISGLKRRMIMRKLQKTRRDEGPTV
ncbi:MAG: peptide deformylase [Rhodospirillaceae bacterium]|nr:MAG: peptide deformylase [Rhodospirillaceae bacterium]